MDDTRSRLSQIETLWDQVHKTQGAPGLQAQTAQDALFQRYAGAVRRYLLKALGDPAAAEDLTQEFGLALVQGRFRQADPQRGRFRDYLKGVLFHLVSQHRRGQKKQSFIQRWWPGPSAPEPADSDSQFNQSWRDELLARTWAALTERQPDLFAVLHHRASHPDQTIEQLAEDLRPQLARSASVENVRQMLHRARKAFTELLLAEVSQSLAQPTVDEIHRELAELDLLAYVNYSAEGG